MFSVKNEMCKHQGYKKKWIFKAEVSAEELGKQYKDLCFAERFSSLE